MATQKKQTDVDPNGVTADHRLTRRGVLVATLCALILSFLQSPGQIAADTKLDLTADPLGFLSRAAHLWTPLAPMGQVQNQAYGYWFPHGAFFSLGELVHLPPWITQRLWWAILLVVGFVGIVRLAEAMRVGSPGARVIAGVVFVLSPRVLTTLGSISSETLPMMLAPWVLAPVVRICAGHRPARPLWREAFSSSAAVALMGAVNAVATFAAVAVAALWWLLHLRLRGPMARRWWRFTGWWSLGMVMACAWWIVPLLILSRVSPPFLDYIESSRVTTQWSSLTEVLRGASSWTPFVSPERVAGAVLVTQPGAVLATGILVAAGLAGLAMRHMPFRATLITLLVVGLLIMCTGYAGTLGSPIAEQVRVFLDGTGAPLRNIHKFEPFIRIPAVLGVAHLLARVPLPTAATVRESLRAFAHPQRSRPVAAAAVILVSLVGAGSLMWTGQIAPAGTYRSMPSYWQDTADWIAEREAQSESATPLRTLVVPGAPFADQLWGLTRDEPLQPLASTPWAVRDAIPLTPPSAIRAMDAVQRQIASGRPSPGLAQTLAGQGIGYVVLRADLDPETSRSARPLMAQQVLDGSAGLRRAVSFGPDVGPPSIEDVVRDNGLRPEMPAITVYEVEPARSGPGTGPTLFDAATAPRVAGGPESIAAIDAYRAWSDQTPLGPALLLDDARAAGLPTAGPRSPGVVVTDTPTDRETDFGRVDDHSSAIRTPDDARRTQNSAADYAVGTDLVVGQWLLDNEPGQVRVTTSGSAADATQPGQTSPANSAGAAFDSDPATAWVSRGLESAVGRWMRIEFTEPRSSLALDLTTAKAIGADVDGVLITTESGSTVASDLEPGEPTTIALPGGYTDWIEIRAVSTSERTAGNQFAVAEIGVTDLTTGAPLSIRQRVALPELPTGTPVAQWILSQELSGRPSCVEDADLVRCAPGLGLSPESPGVFTRSLSVPEPTAIAATVALRPKPGDGLRALLAADAPVTATGPSGVSDPRGSAQAAVDSDPGTVWTAPEDSAHTDRAGEKDEGDEDPVEKKDGDDKDREDKDRNNKDEEDEDTDPRLTIRLAQPQSVERLRLVAPTDYPAAPTEVIVDLGTGPQTREVGDDGVVDLDPAVTDVIELTLTDSTEIIDVNALGFARRAPAGLAEVEIFPTPAATTTTDLDRTVQIGCDSGIGLVVAGEVVRMQATTTARALRDGDTVLARPCTEAEIPVGAGELEVSVNPGEAFTVVAVGLSTPLGPVDPAAGPATPTVGDWSATHRVVDVEAAESTRVLTVAESSNPGWQATVDGPDGPRELQPIVVNGWQQGWVVDAGVSGPVTLRFTFDSLYRWSLGVGLGLMALLLALAWLPLRVMPWTREKTPEPLDPPPTPERTRAVLNPAATAVVSTAWLAASWALIGWWGVVVSTILGVAAAVTLRPFGRPRAWVAGVFVAMSAAAFGLAGGPWHSPTGYVGDQWWVQLPAFVAVSALVWSALGPSVAAVVAAFRRRRSSRRRNQSRAGSSMNA